MSWKRFLEMSRASLRHDEFVVSQQSLLNQRQILLFSLLFLLEVALDPLVARDGPRLTELGLVEVLASLRIRAAKCRVRLRLAQMFLHLLLDALDELPVAVGALVTDFRQFPVQIHQRLEKKTKINRLLKKILI